LEDDPIVHGLQPGNHSEDCEPSEASGIDGDIDRAQQRTKRTKAVTRYDTFS
jgi:hypothetical protein